MREGRDVSRYFIHTVWIIRGITGSAGTGGDQYGEALPEGPTPAALEVNARVEWDRNLVIDDSGKEVVAQAIVFLSHEYTDPGTGDTVPLDIGPEDRILYQGREHTIAARKFMEGWLQDPGRHWELYIR